MKVSLRELFWLVLVVALGCAWWLDRDQLASELDRVTVQYHLDQALYELLTEAANTP